VLTFIIAMVGLAGLLALAAVIASRSSGAMGGGGSNGLSRLIESMRESSERSRPPKTVRGSSGDGIRPLPVQGKSHDQRPTEALGGVPKPLGKEGLRSQDALNRPSSAPRRTLKHVDSLGIRNKRY